jgi:transposase
VQSSAASATPLRLRYCVIRGASVYTIEKALTGHYRAEHLFALEQAVALYDEYQQKVATCDMRIEARSETAQFSSRSQGRGHKIAAATHDSPINGPAFDVRTALYALLGKHVTQIQGLGPYVALKLLAECGDDLAAWPSAKHFTSWLCLRPVTRSRVARSYRREREDPEAARRRFQDWRL